jgi:hypothetical protein
MGASKPTSAAQSEQDLSEALDVDPDEYEWVRQQLESAGVQLRSARLEDEDDDGEGGEGGDGDGDAEDDGSPWRDPSNGPLSELLTLIEDADGGQDEEGQQLLDKVGALVARLEAPTRMLSTPGPDGDTALHLASLYGFARVARSLLDAGADPLAVNPEDGTLALHDAAAGGYDAIVDLLLERGGTSAAAAEGAGAAAAAASTPVNHPDEDGDTPLHCAARGGHLSTVLRLLKAGADPKLENGKGCTARDESDDEKVKALLERLVEAGGGAGAAAAGE